MEKRYDVVIIGAGAAGLFCAIEAGKRGRSVLLIEHNAQVGRKIIISGGGRCNFTNINVSADNFISNNPHFCKSALAGYTPDDFIKLIKKHRIAFYEKKLGQLFCRERSQLIVDMLLAECERADVRLVTDCSVKKVEKISGINADAAGRHKPKFSIETTKGKVNSDQLVIAAGGLSFPKIGASGFGYDVARQFGISVTEVRPSLVPLRFLNEKGFLKLAGVSVEVEANTRKAAFRENILFTHRGLSGPATLQISNYWKRGVPVNFDLLPLTDLDVELKKNRAGRQSMVNFISQFLPKRFAEEFIQRNFSNKPLNQYSQDDLDQISDAFRHWSVFFDETEGWDKAEVTIGGVDTNEISSQTMESKRVSGLYFIGEVLDVTGWLGGYNFHWAWASAHACGNAI